MTRVVVRVCALVGVVCGAVGMRTVAYCRQVNSMAWRACARVCRGLYACSSVYTHASILT